MKKNDSQHLICAISGHSGEKCNFRDQLKYNKADKLASLLPPLTLNKTVAINLTKTYKTE